MDGIKKEREYQIDLIRVISMFFVVILHIIGEGGVIEASESVASVLIFNIIYTIIRGCTNIFAIVTGYLMCSKKIKLSRYIYLHLQVSFIAVICSVFSSLYLNHDILMIKSYFFTWIFPVLLETYWYFTAYTILYMLIPLINKFIDLISKKEYIILLTILYSCFFFIPTFLSRDGFDIFLCGQPLCLIIMYLTGAYIKKYNFNLSLRTLLLTFVILALGLGTCATFLDGFKIPILEKKIEFINSDFSFGIVIMSVVIFLLFRKIKIKSNAAKKVIMYFSSVAFTVYLVHTYPSIYIRLIRHNMGWIADYGFGLDILIVLGLSVAIFLVSAFVGRIQERIFKIIKIKELSAFIEKKIYKIFEVLHERGQVADKSSQRSDNT